jgi:hypothetical protein
MTPRKTDPSEMTRRPAAISILTLALTYCLLPALLRAEPTPSATPVAWELSFQPAPLTRITVEGRTWWYMIYTVTNLTGQDVDFHPEIVRVSEIDNETSEAKALARPESAPRISAEPAVVGVDTAVYKAIADRHAKTYPYLVTPVKAIDRLLEGKDNARTSVAVFPELPRGVARFTIFVGGLSGERQSRPNPRFDASKPVGEDNPKLFVLQKTLSMPFTLPGDDRTRSAATPVLGRMTWVMR